MESPLNTAVLRNSTDAISFLVDKGADMKSRNKVDKYCCHFPYYHFIPFIHSGFYKPGILRK